VRTLYSLESGGTIQLLDDLQWADWDSTGRLLVATRAGKLEVRTLGPDAPTIVFEEDLSRSEPNPGPAPAWATRW
jgi:hypothetical protein